MYCPILRQPPIASTTAPSAATSYYANDDDNKNNNLVLEFMNIAVSLYRTQQRPQRAVISRTLYTEQSVIVHLSEIYTCKTQQRISQLQKLTANFVHRIYTIHNHTLAYTL